MSFSFHDQLLNLNLAKVVAIKKKFGNNSTSRINDPIVLEHLSIIESILVVPPLHILSSGHYSSFYLTSLTDSLYYGANKFPGNFKSGKSGEPTTIHLSLSKDTRIRALHLFLKFLLVFVSPRSLHYLLSQINQYSSFLDSPYFLGKNTWKKGWKYHTKPTPPSRMFINDFRNLTSRALPTLLPSLIDIFAHDSPGAKISALAIDCLTVLLLCCFGDLSDEIWTEPPVQSPTQSWSEKYAKKRPHPPSEPQKAGGLLITRDNQWQYDISQRLLPFLLMIFGSQATREKLISRLNKLDSTYSQSSSGISKGDINPNNNNNSKSPVPVSFLKQIHINISHWLPRIALTHSAACLITLSTFFGPKSPIYHHLLDFIISSTFDSSIHVSSMSQQFLSFIRTRRSTTVSTDQNPPHLNLSFYLERFGVHLSKILPKLTIIDVQRDSYSKKTHVQLLIGYLTQIRDSVGPSDESDSLLTKVIIDNFTSIQSFVSALLTILKIDIPNTLIAPKPVDPMDTSVSTSSKNRLPFSYTLDKLTLFPPNPPLTFIFKHLDKDTSSLFLSFIELFASLSKSLSLEFVQSCVNLAQLDISFVDLDPLSLLLATAQHRSPFETTKLQLSQIAKRFHHILSQEESEGLDPNNYFSIPNDDLIFSDSMILETMGQAPYLLESVKLLTHWIKGLTGASSDEEEEEDIFHDQIIPSILHLSTSIWPSVFLADIELWKQVSMLDPDTKELLLSLSASLSKRQARQDFTKRSKISLTTPLGSTGPTPLNVAVLDSNINDTNTQSQSQSQSSDILLTNALNLVQSSSRDWNPVAKSTDPHHHQTPPAILTEIDPIQPIKDLINLCDSLSGQFNNVLVALLIELFSNIGSIHFLNEEDSIIFCMHVLYPLLECWGTTRSGLADLSRNSLSKFAQWSTLRKLVDTFPSECPSLLEYAYSHNLSLSIPLFLSEHTEYLVDIITYKLDYLHYFPSLPRTLYTLLKQSTIAIQLAENSTITDNNDSNPFDTLIIDVIGNQFGSKNFSLDYLPFIQDILDGIMESLLSIFHLQSQVTHIDNLDFGNKKRPEVVLESNINYLFKSLVCIVSILKVAGYPSHHIGAEFSDLTLYSFGKDTSIFDFADRTAQTSRQYSDSLVVQKLVDFEQDFSLLDSDYKATLAGNEPPEIVGGEEGEGIVIEEESESGKSTATGAKFFKKYITERLAGFDPANAYLSASDDVIPLPGSDSQLGLDTEVRRIEEITFSQVSNIFQNSPQIRLDTLCRQTAQIVQTCLSWLPRSASITQQLGIIHLVAESATFLGARNTEITRIYNTHTNSLELLANVMNHLNTLISHIDINDSEYLVLCCRYFGALSKTISEIDIENVEFGSTSEISGNNTSQKTMLEFLKLIRGQIECLLDYFPSLTVSATPLFLHLLDETKRLSLYSTLCAWRGKNLVMGEKFEKIAEFDSEKQNERNFFLPALHQLWPHFILFSDLVVARAYAVTSSPCLFDWLLTSPPFSFPSGETMFHNILVPWTSNKGKLLDPFNRESESFIPSSTSTASKSVSTGMRGPHVDINRRKYTCYRFKNRHWKDLPAPVLHNKESKLYLIQALRAICAMIRSDREAGDFIASKFTTRLWPIANAILIQRCSSLYSHQFTQWWDSCVNANNSLRKITNVKARKSPIAELVTKTVSLFKVAEPPLVETTIKVTRGDSPSTSSESVRSPFVGKSSRESNDNDSILKFIDNTNSSQKRSKEAISVTDSRSISSSDPKPFPNFKKREISNALRLSSLDEQVLVVLLNALSDFVDFQRIFDPISEDLIHSILSLLILENWNSIPISSSLEYILNPTGYDEKNFAEIVSQLALPTNSYVSNLYALLAKILTRVNSHRVLGIFDSYLTSLSVQSMNSPVSISRGQAPNLNVDDYGNFESLFIVPSVCIWPVQQFISKLKGFYIA